MCFIIIFLAFPITAQEPKAKIKVIAEKATVRSKPDRNSEIIEKDIAVGSVFETKEKKGKWFKIKFRSKQGDLKTGFIHEFYVEVVEEKAEVKTEEIQKPAEKSKKKPVFKPYKEPRKKGFLTFTFNGGLNFVNGGDFNDVVKGRNDHYSDAEWNELKTMMSMSGDLIFNLSDKIGVAIGGGYIFKNNKGTYSYFTRNYKFRIIPLSVSLYFSLPTKGIFGISLHGGVDYYLGSIKHTYSSTVSSSYSEDVNCKTYGFHAGAGVELKLSSRASIVIGGIYRIANFDNWTGSRNSIKGDLYFYTLAYPRIKVYSSAPYSSAQKAKINLGGLGVTAGMKFNL